MNLPIPGSHTYQNAKPFPHLVIDNVFREAEIGYVLQSWPVKHESSISEHEGQKLKSFTFSEDIMGAYISQFIRINFQSQKFIGFLEELTGFKGLVMDCRNPGLHETFPGGFLIPHVDYTLNSATGLQHRVNAILYLNSGWKDEYNGHLELYETNKYSGYLHQSAVKIAPIINRIAIFNIDQNAWHGHAAPLNCPDGMSRKSIALNYFTVPENKDLEKRTIFVNSKIKTKLKPFIPPVLLRLLK